MSDDRVLNFGLVFVRLPPRWRSNGRSLSMRAFGIGSHLSRSGSFAATRKYCLCALTAATIRPEGQEAPEKQ